MDEYTVMTEGTTLVSGCTATPAKASCTELNRAQEAKDEELV